MLINREQCIRTGTKYWELYTLKKITQTEKDKLAYDTIYDTMDYINVRPKADEWPA